MLLDTQSAGGPGQMPAFEGEEFAGVVAYPPAERERAEALVTEHYDVLIRIARAKRRSDATMSALAIVTTTTTTIVAALMAEESARACRTCSTFNL